LVGTSIGLQLGYRERAAVIRFMTPSALANFEALSGWDARRNFGLTAGHSVDDMEVVTALEVGLIDGAPAYIFVVEDSGLMADASWNGLKLTRMTVEP
jgi:lipid-binding SYLF domain-containing protein